MSYVSLLKNIPEIISQPIGIAAIASLGIHGAIAMIVPLMPMEANKPKETGSSKTVGLLELSQADQNRLPQSTPQVGLQQFPPVAPVSPPNFGAQAVLPPLTPPLPSSQLVLPPLPPSSNNYRISSLPTRQSLRMIPSENLRFDASKVDSSKFNAGAKFSPLVPRLNDSKYEVSKPFPINRLPELQSQRIPEDILRNAQPPNLSDTTSIATAQGNTTLNDASKFSQNSLINSLKQTPRVEKTLIGTRGSAPQTADLSAKGTQQAIAQLDSYTNLRKEVQEEYPNARQKSVIREILPTDKPNLEGAVLGVLIVDPDGKVLDIKFQNKFISPELRTKAREYFNKQSPKGDKQISSYPFNLLFQNNTTGATPEQSPSSLAVPRVNSNQLTPSPAATFKPLPELRIRRNQPAPSPASSLKPLVAPEVNSNQPASLPTATFKPLSELRIRNTQPAPSPAATTPEPLSVFRVNKSQPTPTAESEQKLVEQLRQLKEKRQESNVEK
ncbi:hypothetical protein [Nostoc sp. WHI]|uniref:hypothetical protein n=1 Tax=Nostoc sp. WHI TaxID=2650611 RepID=UPI0018C67C16|nr:hypothetical protein [Nostoc sp. WHI]MBG1265152.1 hypothetical protein [Nostoc sp. WHI]